MSSFSLPAQLPDSERPTLTFAVLAYNQEPFIRQAVEAALAQDYTPLQVILSDDCSTDGTYTVMQEMAARYQGPHSVVLNRNPVNLGVTSHVNRVFALAHGELIVLAAGDDVSLPWRSTRIAQTWIAAGRPHGLVHSGWITMSSDPALDGQTHAAAAHPATPSIQDYILTRQALIHGATAAYSRSLAALFGPLPEGAFIEDWILTFRALLAGRLVRIEEPLMRYRIEPGSVSAVISLRDQRRWGRWLNSIIAVHTANRADYLKWVQGGPRDHAFIARLDRLIRQHSHARALLSGGRIGKLRFLFAYPVARGLHNRIAFMLKATGLGDGALYKVLSAPWKAYTALRGLRPQRKSHG